MRGPIGAATLSLKRIGWEVASPFTSIDDRGIELTLTHSTPQLLRDQLVDGVRRSLERQMAHKWASRCQAYACRRICTDLAAMAIRSRAKTSAIWGVQGRHVWRHNDEKQSGCGWVRRPRRLPPLRLQRRHVEAPHV